MRKRSDEYVKSGPKGMVVKALLAYMGPLAIGASPDRHRRGMRGCRYDGGCGRALWPGVATLDWPWVLPGGWEGGGGMAR